MLERLITIAVLAGALLTSGLAAPPPPPAPKTTEAGHGPTIVLIHGLGGTRTMWLPTARKLLPTHHVVLVELPGHGQSPMPEPFSLPAAAELLDRTLAKQKPESTIVVGQGVGGVLAVLAASAHPDRVRGVIVIDSAIRFEQAVDEQQKKFFLQFIDQNYDTFLRQMAARAGRDSAQGAKILAMASRVPPATMKLYYRELAGVDASKPLENLKRPLLFLGTQKRWPASKSWGTVARELGYERAPSITARRLGACGTLIATEQPDSLAMLIRSFSARAIAK